VGDWQIHTSSLDNWKWELVVLYNEDCFGDHVEDVEYVSGSLKSSCKRTLMNGVRVANGGVLVIVRFVMVRGGIVIMDVLRRMVLGGDG